MTDDAPIAEPVPTPPPQAAGPAVPQRGIYADLFKTGYRFDFFQAVRLLEAYFPNAPEPGTSANPASERVHFRPYAATVFPSSDVRSVTLGEDGADVMVTFMGLYGVASPLPVYLYEDLATEAEDTFPLRDFLDIFNHRLYSYFYRAWKKYRPGGSAAGTRSGGTDRFLAIAGLGTPGALAGAPVSVARLAGFAGLLNRRVRNAEGLHTLLSAFTEGLPVEVVQNVPRRVRVADRPALGRGATAATLGGSALVGATVYDVGGKFRVALGPMGIQDFEAYLPGGPKAEALDWLVRLYAPDFLDFDVLLKLETQQVSALRLGDRNARLGENTWVGRGEAVLTERIVTYS
ncbi:MAG: type VI secretion system baseplate subunit TssG [Rhodothermales bacterium]